MRSQSLEDADASLASHDVGEPYLPHLNENPSFARRGVAADDRSFAVRSNLEKP